MQEGTPQSGRSIRCEDVESLAVLYACDELDAAARADLEAHAAACPACAAMISRETRLQQAIVSLEQPAESLDRSGLLLARCRSELAEALDDRQASAGRPAWLEIFSPMEWWGAVRHALIYHPVASMAVLAVASFLAGAAGQQLRVEIGRAHV
jgi:anti-sigma factor RsiW